MSEGLIFDRDTDDDGDCVDAGGSSRYFYCQQANFNVVAVTGDAIVSKTAGPDDSPYDTRTHNTVNEITALDPQGAVGSFNLDWGEGASKSGNLYVLPDRTDPSNKADRFHYDYRNRLMKVEHSDDYGEGTPTWSTVVTYYYDGLNRRVKKDLASGTDIIYLYDGWRVLEEREWDTNGEGST